MPGRTGRWKRRVRQALAVRIAPWLRPYEYEVSAAVCEHPEPLWQWRPGRFYGMKCLDCGYSTGANHRSPYLHGFPFNERI
jgi:hypothetical protein